MDITTAATLYILLWVSLASAPILLKYPLKIKASIWLVCMAITLIVGYFLDNAYAQAPHTAWQQASLYITFSFISAFMATPALLYQRAQKIK